MISYTPPPGDPQRVLANLDGCVVDGALVLTAGRGISTKACGRLSMRLDLDASQWRELLEWADSELPGGVERGHAVAWALACTMEYNFGGKVEVK